MYESVYLYLKNYKNKFIKIKKKPYKYDIFSKISHINIFIISPNYSLQFILIKQFKKIHRNNPRQSL